MKTILRSKDLNCPSCVDRIEKALLQVEGVDSAKVRFNSGKIEVEHDGAVASQDDLVGVVQRAGYESKVSAF